MIVADALGPDHRIAQVLRRRLTEAGAQPDDRLILAAAGSSDHAGVEDALQTGLLLEAATRHPVTVGFLSAAAPRLHEAIARHRSNDGARVAVAGYLLAPGFFHDRTRTCAADIVTAPLLTPDTPPAPELIAVARDRYSTALSASGSASTAARGPRTNATDDATTP
ncbi:sirohydrochlorin chelatase [Leifsonia sp. P73]|uniref:sirohydrochlorin chelatase n=1 Tax=Leifsonia sp. P73 TaxID=3423959 RepID=UPI003DA26B5A